MQIDEFTISLIRTILYSVIGVFVILIVRHIAILIAHKELDE
jgi:hypothetical protein